MIRILRPQKIPKVLHADGRQRRDEHVAQHSQGDTAFIFDRAVYGHTEVKAALRIAQHDKCGFCESKVSHVAFGDVEHFRPKSAVRSRPGEALISPGYFWLAYEWENLMFACECCNRRHKGNLFPLFDETTRARAPSDIIDRESPLFIDPSREDPAAHIGFREEVPYAIGGNARGEATIDALGLHRPELVERRRDRLQKLRQLRRAMDLLKRKRGPESKTLVKEISAELLRSTEDGAEYSGMVRWDIATAA
jgi:hypothetical protein